MKRTFWCCTYRYTTICKKKLYRSMVCV